MLVRQQKVNEANLLGVSVMAELNLALQEDGLIKTPEGAFPGPQDPELEEKIKHAVDTLAMAVAYSSKAITGGQRAEEGIPSIADAKQDLRDLLQEAVESAKQENSGDYPEAVREKFVDPGTVDLDAVTEMLVRTAQRELIAVRASEGISR